MLSPIPIPRYCRLYVLAYPIALDRFEVICAQCDFQEWGERALSVYALTAIQQRHDSRQLPQ